MAFVKNLFDKNFLEYASYVIRDRAIPDLEDGLKPVQRRIMLLFEIDDGKFHKVADVVGQCIVSSSRRCVNGGALVVLANKDICIDKQNFGNIYAEQRLCSRYIECRAPLSKIFFIIGYYQINPSYDGRGKTCCIPWLPMVLIMGGRIAVRM